MSLATLLAIAGVTLLLLGVLSRPIERLFLSSVAVATLVGIVLGPEVAGVLDPAEAGDARGLMEHVAAVTLAIALMATGLEVTTDDLRENAGRSGLLLTAGMVGMWAVSGLGAWLILDLPFWVGFLLGAILTPTDPVVASVIVTSSMAKKMLPRWLRRTLQIEAGGNDGLALPLVLLAGALATEPTAEALGGWVADAAGEVGLALVCGLGLGLASARLVGAAMRRGEIEESHLTGLGIALALSAFGVTRLLGGSGILAVFVAALAFSATLDQDLRDRLGEVQEAVAKFFVLPAFVLFGAILPWDDWQALGASGLLFAAWILLLRRPVAIALVLRRRVAPGRSRLFLGWFGPLGVAAIFYATYSERFGVPEYERLFAAATLAVFCSVLVHSLTATPGVRAFAGRSPFSTVRHPFSEREEAQD